MSTREGGECESVGNGRVGWRRLATPHRRLHAPPPASPDRSAHTSHTWHSCISSLRKSSIAPSVRRIHVRDTRAFSQLGSSGWWLEGARLPSSNSLLGPWGGGVDSRLLLPAPLRRVMVSVDRRSLDTGQRP